MDSVIQVLGIQSGSCLVGGRALSSDMSFFAACGIVAPSPVGYQAWEQAKTRSVRLRSSIALTSSRSFGRLRWIFDRACA